MIPTAPGKKAVLYCRVSSKEQEESGYSLPAQQKFLKEHADKNGLEVVNVFPFPNLPVDGSSGTYSTR